MPTTIFEKDKDVERFRSAIESVGGTVTHVLPCPPFVAVRYRLPKGRKSEGKKIEKANRLPKKRR